MENTRLTLFVQNVKQLKMDIATLEIELESVLKYHADMRARKTDNGIDVRANEIIVNFNKSIRTINTVHKHVCTLISQIISSNVNEVNSANALHKMLFDQFVTLRQTMNSDYTPGETKVLTPELCTALLKDVEQYGDTTIAAKAKTLVDEITLMLDTITTCNNLIRNLETVVQKIPTLNKHIEFDNNLIVATNMKQNPQYIYSLEYLN